MTVKQIEPAVLFDSNIYLILGSRKTVLIDTGTGFGSDAVISNIKKELGSRNLDMVILTHRHYDHVGGLDSIIKAFSPAEIYAGPKDAVPLREGDSESTLGTKFGGRIYPTDVKDYSDGDMIDIGEHVLRCIETPGHTVGSICVYDETTQNLFSGDTVFVDGVGNTSHPTGSSAELIQSLKKLVKIDIKGFYPGHGPFVNNGGNEFVIRGLKFMGVQE